MKQLIIICIMLKFLVMIKAKKMIVTSSRQIILFNLNFNSNNETSNIESGNQDQPTGDASTVIGIQLLRSTVLQINTPFG